MRNLPETLAPPTSVVALGQRMKLQTKASALPSGPRDATTAEVLAIGWSPGPTSLGSHEEPDHEFIYLVFDRMHPEQPFWVHAGFVERLTLD
jgi:hypothetical protein